MSLNVKPGEQYVIRRKILKLFGASFHLYDPAGNIVGFCKQKAFKLREDITLFADEAQTTPLLTLKARQIIDFGVTFDVALPDGSPIGSLRRKGLKSSFVRDEWLVYNPQETEIAMIRERGGFAPFARRFIDAASLFLPQKFDVIRTSDETHLAEFRQHFNPMVYRLSVSILADDPDLDELVILAAGCLIAAIEGRQN